MSCEELGFLDWVAKMNEKITFVLLNLKEHREITEDDYSLMKMWFGRWRCGEHPLYQAKMEGTVETVVQQGLFSANTSVLNSEEGNGMIVDTTVEEPIKE